MNTVSKVTTGSPPRHCTLGQRTGIFVEMILPLLEALLPLLLLFATDFLGRGIERHANGLHPEPTLGRGRFSLYCG